METLTYEQQEANRRDRLAEVGTLPECPMCGRARVQRSDYVRCNPCGLNWLEGDDLSRNPVHHRWERFIADTLRSSRRKGDTAQPAR